MPHLPKKRIIQKYINRELSWLSFNDRVLQEAYDPMVPLVERFRFMGIFSSNLDEFFRVRVASLSRMLLLNKRDRRSVGFNPQKTLKRIQELVIQQQNRFDHLYHEILIPELAEEKIFLLNEKQLNVSRGLFVKEYFKERILPLLTPIMLEKDKPIPFLKDKSIYLFVKLYNKNHPLKQKFALIEVPTDVHSRFIILPETNNLKFIILLEDAIRYCLEDVFSLFNYTHFEAYSIKLTRDAELDYDSDLSTNVIDSLSKSLKQRRKGKPVRFTFDNEMPRELLNFLIGKLNLLSENIIPGGRYHNFKDFMSFPNVGIPSLEYAKPEPLSVKNLNSARSMLAEIAEKDCIIHLPYQTFDYFIRFLRESAIDPRVVSIKITLYRVAKESRVINALINAAKNGKQVTVIIELKARFDEEANIHWTQKLIDEGVTVVHGIQNKKVHAKMCLVTRKEKNKLVHYVNLSTGNYNEHTSKVYCDHMFFTADRRITKEVVKLFSYLEKSSIKGTYHYLMVAPLDMREKIISLIDNEITLAKKGINGSIIIKLNSLADVALIDKLYAASTAGVKIKLIIRGICCLVPGVSGMSENIEVISIIDKYLEHARIFIFENGGNSICYVSSGDWMARNLDHRVEVAFPILDKNIQEELKHIIMLQQKDNTKARLVNVQKNNAYKVSKGNNYRAQIDIYNYLKAKNL